MHLGSQQRRREDTFVEGICVYEGTQKNGNEDMSRAEVEEKMVLLKWRIKGKMEGMILWGSDL